MGRGIVAALLVLVLQDTAQAGENYDIKSFRWDEDYSSLASSDAARTGLEALKFVALNDARTSWLTLGADTRARADVIENGSFSLRPGGDYTTVTTRALFLTDWHFSRDTRVFLQFGFHDENGRRPRARSFDESEIDLQQGFVDVPFGAAIDLRVGRQELPLGGQRLSDAREGGNIRRSFDGARAEVKLGAVDALAFWTRPVANEEGAFDDRPADGDSFYGVYATAPLAKFAGLDLYWLVREKAASVFASGTAAEDRSSVGARFFGGAGPWDYDVQALAQFGSFGAEDIRAYGATVDVGWTARSWAWAPHFSLRADIASGDAQPGDDEMGSFDAPFPNFSYLSATSAYWPGNAWSVFPLLTATPADGATFYLGAQYMARLSTGDAFYYQPQTPIALPGTEAHGVMTQIYTRLRWQPTPHWVFSATAIYQAAGRATNDAGGEDTVIGSTSVAWRF